MESSDTDSSVVVSLTRGKGERGDVKSLTASGHECISRSDHEQALSLFQSALDKASGPTERLTCLMNAGACLVSLRKYSPGLDSLRSALAIMKDETPSGGERNGLTTLQNDKSLLADLHYNIAMAGDGLEDSSLTQTHLKQCVDCYIQTGKDGLAADTFLRLARHYQRQGEHREQITALLGAHRLTVGGSDRGREALGAVQLAFAYLHDGQVDECKSMVATTKLMALKLNSDGDDATVKGTVKGT